FPRSNSVERPSLHPTLPIGTRPSFGAGHWRKSGTVRPNPIRFHANQHTHQHLHHSSQCVPGEHTYQSSNSMVGGTVSSWRCHHRDWSTGVWLCGVPQTERVYTRTTGNAPRSWLDLVQTQV